MARTKNELLAELNRDMDRTLPVSMASKAGRRSANSPPVPKTPLHPNSLAALAAHRKRTQLDQANGSARKRCKFCNRVVVKDMEVCYFHGGAQTVAARRRQKGLPIAKTSTQARRNVRRLLRRGEIPLDLLRDPLFQAVGMLAEPSIFGKKYQRDGSPTHKINAHLLLRELVIGWLAMVDGDPEPWTQAVTKAYQMGFRPVA